MVVDFLYRPGAAEGLDAPNTGLQNAWYLGNCVHIGHQRVVFAVQAIYVRVRASVHTPIVAIVGWAPPTDLKPLFQVNLRGGRCPPYEAGKHGTYQ